MTAQMLATFGLVLDIVGVWLLWFRPRPMLPVELEARQSALLLDGEQYGPTPEEKAATRDRWNEFRRFSRWGLWLLTVGFALQALSAWMR